MNQPRLARIDQTKMRETVHEALARAFTRGDFAPGDVLSLRDLSEQLGCSITPVREAVRRLVAEGALIDTPSRTLMVPPFDARRLRDLKAARLALELLVLDQVLDAAKSQDIAMLEAIIGPDTQKSGDPDLEQNHAFHFALYRLSGSEVLLALIQGLWMQYGAYLNLIIREEAATQLEEHRYHHEILAAMRDGNREAARRALQADIERSFAVLLPPGEAPE